MSRGVFKSAKEARTALEAMTAQLNSTGAFPAGTVVDRAGQFLVPIGNKGMAVYKLSKKGTAALQTTLNAWPL